VAFNVSAAEDSPSLKLEYGVGMAPMTLLLSTEAVTLPVALSDVAAVETAGEELASVGADGLPPVRVTLAPPVNGKV